MSKTRHEDVKPFGTFTNATKYKFQSFRTGYSQALYPNEVEFSYFTGCCVNVDSCNCVYDACIHTLLIGTLDQEGFFIFFPHGGPTAKVPACYVLVWRNQSPCLLASFPCFLEQEDAKDLLETLMADRWIDKVSARALSRLLTPSLAISP